MGVAVDPSHAQAAELLIEFFVLAYFIVYLRVCLFVMGLFAQMYESVTHGPKSVSYTHLTLPTKA